MRERPVGLAERGAARLDEAPGERARGGERDLLAEDGADGALGRVDGAGRAHAGGRRDERGERRVGGEDVVVGARVGVEVEQAAARGDGRVEVGARARARRVARTWSSRGTTATTPGPPGRRSVRRYAPSRISSMPGTARAASQRSTPAPSNGGRVSRRRTVGAAVTTDIVVARRFDGGGT